MAAALLAIPAACAGSAGVRASAGEIPFVGCRSGGQQGDHPPPASGPVPAIPSSDAAERLAYYSDGTTAVLAPRGWHCASSWGSSGGALLVTPKPGDAESWFRMRPRSTPVYGVQLTYNHGGTSGRFAVADMVARYFPQYIDFARTVAAEEVADPLPKGPYAGDRLRQLSPTEIEFTTPAGQRGVGVERSNLAAGDGPVRGLIALHPDEHMLLVQLALRLPAPDETLVSAIIDEVRLSGGAAAE